MKPNQKQQGDVIFTRITEIPKSANRVKPDHRGHVLAEGEATGHAHTIEDSDAELYREGERLLALIHKTSTVKHQEHGPVMLEPGIWEIGRVREYDYLSKIERWVMD